MNSGQLRHTLRAPSARCPDGRGRCTVPMLARDAKRIEDVDTTGPDHGADAIRYGCLRTEWATELKFTWGRDGGQL